MSSGSSPGWLDLGPGEVFLRSAGANRSTGAVAAGGWLALTSQRLVHHTHAVEKALTRTQDWSAALHDIAGVEVLPTTPRPSEVPRGVVRRRLRVTTRDGVETLFVVDGGDGWRDAVEGARHAAGASAASSARCRYWLGTVPLQVSVHVTLLLGVLLLAQALGFRSVGAAFGGVFGWLIVNLWRTRPSAEGRADRLRAQPSDRPHTSGVVVVERPRRGRDVGSVTIAVAEPEQAARTRAVAATWALLLVAVDATVVVVLLTTDEWGLWVTAVAVALLATHLWLAARTLRGPRRAAGA